MIKRLQTKINAVIFFENAINRVQYKSRRILPTNSSVDGIPEEMAPTLTPPIPRVHPSIKHQPNHGICSHLPTPILTDPTIAIYSFHHELLATISLDLLLSHVEGVDCLLPMVSVQSVGWSGAMM